VFGIDNVPEQLVPGPDLRPASPSLRDVFSKSPRPVERIAYLSMIAIERYSDDRSSNHVRARYCEFESRYRSNPAGLFATRPVR
jgi:hypothetical protein